MLVKFKILFGVLDDYFRPKGGDFFLKEVCSVH